MKNIKDLCRKRERMIAFIHYAIDSEYECYHSFDKYHSHYINKNRRLARGQNTLRLLK